MYYIRTIWLKVAINFCTYCYSARQWLRVGASAWRPVIWSVCFNPMDTVLLRRNSFSRIVNAGSYTKGSGGWEPTEGSRNGSSWEILPAQVQWTIATILCGWEREREARPRSRSVSGSILDNQRDRTTNTITGACSKCDLGYSFQVIIRSYVRAKYYKSCIYCLYLQFTNLPDLFLKPRGLRKS